MSEEKKFTLEELEKDLDDSWKIFCHEHIKYWEKARPYMKAYPDSSFEAAAVSANRLLKKAKVQQYIEFIKNNIAEEAGISKLALINELKILAFSNLPQIILKYNEGGLNALSEDEQKSIVEYIYNKKQLGEEGTIVDSSTKLKLHDKRGAIQDIIKAMGWNEAEKIDLSTEVNTLKLVKASESRSDSQD